MPLSNRFLFHSCLLFAGLLGCIATAQEITGNELLESAIAYHDPNGKWKNFKGKMSITMKSPNAEDRNTLLFMNLPAQYFKSAVRKGNHTIESLIEKDSCTLKLNGSTNIAQVYRDSLRISCERARMMKNYYTYLYGLPMKLKDPGTLINPNVQKKTFKGKEYLVLKVTYDESIGNDTWYFYFDPKTYAMEVYQFFHDESKNDGEYILLSDMMELNALKIPKIRAWYYNKNDKYLGTDNLNKLGAL
ncbi:DUF6503 family protein [Maribacter aestuarii]|uniref:DUF6503 family protein n=1 Tax=Maribacter aestuarii TaxID=1130723 RepID=UPI00248B3B60|nr:DUF6503 family protein [Maribacter aestuarii]